MKKAIKNIVISIIVGAILGFIAEFALIFNINWLIKITQSYNFWFFIMWIVALLSKEYIFSLLNPVLTIISMNNTYYLIRLFKSGFTNIGNWQLFSITGIAGAIYIGTFIYFIKSKFTKKYNDITLQKYSLIFMSIGGLCLGIYGLFHPIFYNLFYEISFGIFIGYIFSILFAKIKKSV